MDGCIMRSSRDVATRLCIFLFLMCLTPSLCWSCAGTVGQRSNNRALSGEASSTLSCWSTRNDNDDDDDDASHSTLFPRRNPPYLAVITEPDACDSDEAVNRTFEAISQAVSNSQVDLISIRQTVPAGIQDKAHVSDRLTRLSKQLLELSQEFPFRLVVSSDWIDAIVHEKVRVHGIHVKESHRERIPEIRKMFQNNNEDAFFIIGTSAHSVISAVDAWHKYRPDYMFVGTCYLTQTHPEKSVDDLEGPALPGLVAQALQNAIDDSSSTWRPIIFAIGGIDAKNCHEPVRVYGADGVATIRAVLQSSDPAQTVREMKQNMQASNT
eukprot:scaffold3267_cov142-Amphora_coffeaeformis.AAC.4